MADSVTIEGLSLWNQAYVERYNKLREVFTNHTKTFISLDEKLFF